MRREDQVGRAPERVIRRQRLIREHIDNGAAELAALQRIEQVGSDKVFAATDVDQLGAGLGPRKRGSVEQAARSVSERQQAIRISVPSRNIGRPACPEYTPIPGKSRDRRA